MNCKAKASTGKRCKAKAMKGSEYCFYHNKDVKDQHIAAVKKGGENRKTLYDLEQMNITGFDDIPKTALQILNELRTGKIDTKMAYAQGYMLNVYINAESIKTDINKLDEIEKFIEEKKRN